jgi:hypothetical protein
MGENAPEDVSQLPIWLKHPVTFSKGITVLVQTAFA